MTRILVTGGAGYIGSHTTKRLSHYGIETAVFDNLSRGHRDFVKWGPLIEGDLRNAALLRETLRWFKPDVVLHFAAFAYVGESFSNPGLYYDNNVGGTVALLQAMHEAGIDKIVLSSSCATYGQPDHVPITESTPQRPINPYGMSKLMMEQVCADFERAHGLRFVPLRYFNAAGCDPSGHLGERHEPETHLIPLILEEALRILNGGVQAHTKLMVFGDDFPTIDGTCIRDYIHVQDLCSAHLNAVQRLMTTKNIRAEAYNLGNGKGYSVLEVIEACRRVTGVDIRYNISPRRPGDPAWLVGSAEKAKSILGWQPKISGIDDIVSTAWNWIQAREASGTQ